LATGKLIRKLLWWTVLGIVVIVAVSLLLSFGLHTYGAARLASAKAEFSQKWGRLADYEPPPPVPDDENGGAWLVAGGEAIVCSVEDRRFYGQLSDRPENGWTEAERSRARRILQEQKNALEILVRSGDFDTFNLSTNGVRATYESVDFSSIVMGIRLLVLESQLAWSEGRTGDALAALNAVGRAADGLLQTPIIIMSSIGSAAERWAAAVAAEIVSDPLATGSTLRELRAVLPREDPILRANITLAIAIAEMAGEGLGYIEHAYDPSMGWSVPFWISNRYLLEDLYVAGTLEAWMRHLELGQMPAAQWSSDDIEAVWKSPAWPSWLALTGNFSPNLLAATARGQAASTELQQLGVAIELRLAAPDGLGPDACGLIDEASPTALTGGPITCRFDATRCGILIEVPGAEDALDAFVASDNPAALIPPIELPVGEGCEQADQGS
jgi:hypothetical protein